MTQEELAIELKKLGFPLDHAAISTYERGAHRPTAAFIWYVVRALDLNDDQENALIHAHFADVTGAFLRDYLSVPIRNKKRS